jgi:hypothetical protein
MDIANFIIGLTSLIAAGTAAVYAYKTYSAGQEPRLSLHYSIPYFTLRNIGSTTARNVTEIGGCFNNVNIPELFNYSGPVNPAQTGSSSVVSTMGLSANINVGEKWNAVFKYENLAGKKFKSVFAISRSATPNLAVPFSTREVSWGRI